MSKVCSQCHTDKPLSEYYTRKSGQLSECKECNKARARKWSQAHKDRKIWLEKNRLYGVSKDTYETLLNKQNHVCAICKGPCLQYGKLSIDHDHNTGSVRGLLCTNCNQGLGRFKDDPVLLKRAIEYLERSL